jgi:hypothetical protein
MESSRKRKSYINSEGEQLSLPTKDSPRQEKIEYLHDALEQAGYDLPHEQIESMFSEKMIIRYSELADFS